MDLKRNKNSRKRSSFSIAIILLVFAFLRIQSYTRNLQDSAQTCADIDGKHRTLRGAISSLAEQDPWELGDIEIWEKGKWSDFSAILKIKNSLLSVSPKIGQKVLLSGAFRCVQKTKNPSQMSDLFLSFQEKTLLPIGKKIQIKLDSRKLGLINQFPFSFDNFLFVNLQKFPALLGLSRAVWSGDTSGLPEIMMRCYQQGGLLHILALSGQHVVILVLLAHFFLRTLLKGLSQFSGIKRWLSQTKTYSCVLRVLPSMCAGFLFMTSSGLAPIRRTWVMALVVWVLQIRQIECSILNVIFSTVACLLIFEPSLTSSCSFFLSAVCTAILMWVLANLSVKNKVKSYLLVGSCLPLLVLPSSIFMFNKVSLLAPLLGVLLTWVWELCFIPLGFILPLVSCCLPSILTKPLFSGFSILWESFVKGHLFMVPYVEQTYLTSVGLYGYEWFCMTALALIGVKGCVKRVVV